MHSDQAVKAVGLVLMLTSMHSDQYAKAVCSLLMFTLMHEVHRLRLQSLLAGLPSLTQLSALTPNGIEFSFLS